MRRQIRIKEFKIERPVIYLGDGPFFVLAYDRYRNDRINMELTPEIEALFGEDHVIYVRAFFDQQGNLNIVEKVEKPRGW